MAYQLLCALRDSHAHNVYHGDIKTENILVTSWNWLYLTDYSSSFKKTYLPEDNPADFSYYFDTSGRRTCYLAPERFLATEDKDDGRGVTWAMDVFSVGCVIAELFLETPIFSLSQLYKYRKGEYDPQYVYLSKIQDIDVREMVTHMIQLEPEYRYSAEEYLNFWRRKAFPEYFYSFLHQYMGLITDPTSGRTPIHPDTANLGEADDRIDRVFYDFDKISYFLDHESEIERAQQVKAWNNSNRSEHIIPVQIDIPNNRHEASNVKIKAIDDGSLIFLSLVVSSLRNTARSTARVRACDLMLAFAERVTDEAKLDRILPYVVAMLYDSVDIVKVAAIRTMTQLLSLVVVVSPGNAYVFRDYVRPKLQESIREPASKASPLARSTYASCLATLAHTSSRFLDMLQALQADGSVPTVEPETDNGALTQMLDQHSFDAAKLELLEHFEVHTKALLIDNDASVRRAFLECVSSLCVFFGSSKANDVILSHLNTYLNDKDWILKCSFFQTIVGVATFVGGKSLEDFILPLMIQALADPEEFVIQRVITSFANMAELGLFQRSKIWEMLDAVASFMMHPNVWIREAAAHFVSSSTRYLSTADLYCIILPVLQPFLKASIADYSEISILDALKRPLPRSVLDMATTWATKTEASMFWKPCQGSKRTPSSPFDLALLLSASKLSPYNDLKKAGRNDEDEQWIRRLQNIGMNADDEMKLSALRDYVWRVAHRQSKAQHNGLSPSMGNILCLREIDVTPQTIFFSKDKKNDKLPPRSNGQVHAQMTRSKSGTAARTIADALLDASTTMENPMSQQKKIFANARRERLTSEAQTLPKAGEIRRGSSNLASPLSSSPDRWRQLHQPSSNDIGEIHSSDGTVTPTNSIRSGQAKSIKQKSSAINLLNRRDTSKTTAETSTTSANVMGKVDGVSAQEPSELRGLNHDKFVNTQISTQQDRFTHTYDGKDPNLTRLLDNLAYSRYPNDIDDFGPMVTSGSAKHYMSNKADSEESKKPWRPGGTLVATFGEHTGPINRVMPSPDHAFFITASDDGTVKVWDTIRLERNLTHRSRLTFTHAQETKVTCIIFVEHTHTFVSGATDGSVKVVRVDYSRVEDEPKYKGLQMMREFQLPSTEYALWLEHSKLETHSLLLLGTNKSRVIALDLRNMEELYSFENPIHHGTLTCFCVDHRRGWLLIGTSHGVLDLWDLRFRLHIKAWRLTAGTAIHRLMMYPFNSKIRSHGKWVYVAGGTGETDISIWDIETAECLEVYHVDGARRHRGDMLKLYEPQRLEAEKPETMLDRFATTVNLSTEGTESQDHGIRAVAIGIDYSWSEQREARTGYILAGGTDKKIRCWDVARPDVSRVVSGLEAGEDQPKYSTSRPTTSLTIHTENAHQQNPSALNAAAGSGRSKKTTLKPPRSTIMSVEQQHLLRNHLDVILDVTILEGPVNMMVSVDRMGCIYVVQ